MTMPSGWAGGNSTVFSSAGEAKAWVNFNGTGTVAIRASFNVSSITDNGTGDYTVNFKTAMPDVNYAAIGSTQGSGVSVVPIISMNQGNSQTTTKVNVYLTGGVGGVTFDYNYVAVAIFR